MPTNMRRSRAGAISAARKRHDQQNATEPPFQSVALVVGCTGIVGTSLVDILPLPDTPGGPWKVYALSRRPFPPWSPPPSPAVTHLHLDLADSAAVAEALAPLTDITHVFYVAWAPHFVEDQNREANTGMLRNLLSVVVPNCPALVHVSLQTGLKHYMGPPESIGKFAIGTPFSEDMPRLPDCPNFYYDQEDVLFDAVSRRRISWSVHRPSLIFGFSPRSAMNVVCTLCVYAAICRKEGNKLRWPGSLGAWEGFSNASDADLIAEQHIWAAVDVAAKNQAFNCSNGDIYKWKQLWPVLAGRFGLEWSGYEGEESRVGLMEAMEGKDAVLAEIVREEGLVVTELEEVASWWFVDALFMDKWEFLDTMNKSKEHGFMGFRNTVKSFQTWIDRMKLYKISPIEVFNRD
uniref:PRISE-like Rossmann-fold domain-containing protein n=1 Tax=Leersia perrieri TaxID=77586 RepID=A0A0D9VVJ4_9ORYZ